MTSYVVQECKGWKWVNVKWFSNPYEADEFYFNNSSFSRELRVQEVVK